MLPYSLSILTGNPGQKAALKRPNAECGGTFVSVHVKTNTVFIELITKIYFTLKVITNRGEQHER